MARSVWIRTGRDRYFARGPDGNPGWDPEVVLAYVPNNSSSGLSVVYIESYTE